MYHVGTGHKAGGVAALEGIRHPFRCLAGVMEKTRHVLLVGEGARQFAVSEGFEWIEPRTEAHHMNGSSGKPTRS